MKQFNKYDKVILAIKNESHYNMDGCQNGDEGIIVYLDKHLETDEIEGYFVDVTRQDGTVAEDFYVDPKDIEELLYQKVGKMGEQGYAEQGYHGGQESL